MADEDAMNRLWEGREAWNNWKQTRKWVPDLSDAPLSNRDLSGFDLSSLPLYRANLMSARLVGVNLYNADLAKANLSNAVMGFTILARTSLQEAIGLESVEHVAKSSIGVDTFFRSGGLPESFLRGCGVPEEFIQYASALVGTPIKYYSCFLSYSHKDEAFARQLHKDLLARNIRVWYAPEDLKIGDRFRPRIDEAIHLHEKLVLILSKDSVGSAWVEDEVERALARERREKCDVLFPIRLDDTIFTTDKAWARGILDQRNIGDFRTDYDKALDRLVRNLKKSQPPIVMR